MVDLVDPNTLKNYLDLEKTFNATNYPQLSTIFDQMQGSFEVYLHRVLDADTYTDSIYIPYKTRIIPLRALPVSSVSSVSVEFGGSTTPTTLSADQYKIRPYGLQLVTAQVTDADITVIYNGGWDADQIPLAMQKAALLQMLNEYESKDHVGVEVVTNEMGSVTLPEIGLLKEVKRLLNPYVHPHYGR